MSDWKNYLKGFFDTKPPTMKVLVTGSAQLDVYDHLGDSLAGRYFRHRLLPFSLAELTQIGEKESLNKLIERGGFPEPFLETSDTEAQRWRQQYINSLLSTDVFDIGSIHNIKAMRLVFEILRNQVGSTISYSSLARDIAVSPITIKKYIEILEALFIIFRVTPYSRNIARSLLKEPKIYFFDNGLVRGDDGARLENCVAGSLLKSTYGLVDYEGKAYALNYVRTKEGKEVDFAVSCDNKIEYIAEVKMTDGEPNKALLYFAEKYSYKAFQLVKNVRHDHTKSGINFVNAERFLSNLFL